MDELEEIVLTELTEPVLVAIKDNQETETYYYVRVDVVNGEPVVELYGADGTTQEPLDYIGKR